MIELLKKIFSLFDYCALARQTIKKKLKCYVPKWINDLISNYF